MTLPLVIPFDAPESTRLDLVGGKGASLGEMTQHGLRVPPGFTVSTGAYRRFLDAADVAVKGLLEHAERLAPDDTEAIRQSAKSIRETLGKVSVPPDLDAEVRAQLAHTPTIDRWAVRSSATLEDLPGASFAGQHDTHLEVTTEQVLERLRDCWISLFTDRAMAYRRQQGLSEDAAQMAVVVQQMATADTAGVMFTADPMTGRRDLCTVDAAYGLGEAVVSGVVNPDAYTVDKTTGKVVDRQLGSKALAILPLPQGKTETVAVEQARQTTFALSDDQLAALARLARDIESLKGAPQDVEWAFADDQPMLLQSRPITSLYPAPEPTPGDGSMRVYICMGHQQANPAVWSPMFLSLLHRVIPIGRDPVTGLCSIFATAGHRGYVDVTKALYTFPFSRVFPRLASGMSPAIGQRLLPLPGRKDLKARRPKGRLPLLGVVRLFGPVLRRVLFRALFRAPEGALLEWQAYIPQVSAELEARLAQAQGDAATLAEVRAVLSSLLLRLFQTMALPILGPGVFAQVALTRLMKGRVPDRTVDDLTQGVRGNIVTEMSHELADLADVARQTPGLVEVLLKGPAPKALDEAASVPGSETFLSGWRAFLERYGHRCPGELDLAVPRWRDDPSSLLQMMRGMWESTKAGAHLRNREEKAKKAEAAEQLILREAGRGVFGVVRRPMARFFMRRVKSLMRLREHHKFLAILVFGHVRDALMRVAQSLVEQGRLAAADDVWMLRDEELHALVQGQKLKDHLVDRRRADHERFAKMFPPAVLLSTGEIPALPPRTDLPKGALGGAGVSAGTVEGIARVLRNPAEQSLHQGEILVAPFTDAAWTTLFVVAGGVVLEAGGAMSHGSVVAREYGIPAVVGVERATEKIADGQRIRVDGERGIVEVLGKEAAEVDP